MSVTLRTIRGEDFDAALSALIKDTFTKHRRIIFNGNGYSEEWEQEAARRGLSNLKNSVDAYKTFAQKKNIELFARHGVMSEVEVLSRQEILFENYSKIINIEAKTMVDMTARDILPAVHGFVAELAAGVAAKKAAVPGVDVSAETDVITRLSTLTGETYAIMQQLREAGSKARHQKSAFAMAESFCYEVLPLMCELRAKVDKMETLTASNRWPMPTYGDLMFNI